MPTGKTPVTATFDITNLSMDVTALNSNATGDQLVSSLPSSFVRIFNDANSDIQVRINSGSWVNVLGKANAVIDANMASDTVRMRLGTFVRETTVPVRADVYGVPNVLSVGEGSGAALDDRAAGFPGAAAVQVGASRALTAADNGRVLECTTTLTLTVPVGLPSGFSCKVLASGTTSVARSGAALINGAGTVLTRAAATNPVFEIMARGSAVDSYVVTGA